MSQKIVINNCYGGFGLSDEATILYAKRKGITLYSKKENSWNTSFYTSSDMSKDSFYYPIIDRDDPDLITVVETLGKRANGKYAQLKIVEIPNGVRWQIEEYDGSEHIAEQHRTWG